MSVNSIYSIEIVSKGIDQANNAAAAVDKISTAVGKINSSFNPLTKIIQLLETTNNILLGIGNVGVSSFNKLDNINTKVSEGFRKSTTIFKRAFNISTAFEVVILPIHLTVLPLRQHRNRQ